jgi:hypothetical protein
MANPAAIHITSAPVIRNEKVLKTKAVSSDTAAWAGPASNNARLAMPMPTTDIRFNALMR